MSYLDTNGVQSLWGKATTKFAPKTVASHSTDGLMSSTDKIKLDNITSGANSYTHPSYTSRESGLYKITVDSTGHISAATAVAKSDITALGIPSTNTTYSVFGRSGSGAATGLVPTPPTTAGTTKYLREDGTWVVPPNTLYGVMGAAGASAAGKAGLVPAPGAGKQTSFLRGDGTWVIPTGTTYSNASTNAAGLMSSTDKSKLDGIASGANAYSLPAATSSTLGGVTIGSNITLTSGSISLTKENITAALGYTPPKTDTNTTYGVASTSSNGLMSSTDKSKLDGIATGANNYSHPTYTAKSSGLYKVTVDSTGHVSEATAVTKNDITALGIPAQDTNTTYGTFVKSGSGAAAGLVPAPSTTAGTTKYLREDGTWAKPDGQTYTNATTSTAGLMSPTDKSKLDGLTTGTMGVYVFKSIIDSSSSLPSSNNNINDLYVITGSSTYGPANTKVYWNGSTWVKAPSSCILKSIPYDIYTSDNFTKII